VTKYWMRKRTRTILEWFAVMMFFLFIFAFDKCHGQNTTTLTGTVTDSDSQTWNSASWTARIVVPTGGSAVYISGGAVPNTFTGTLSSAGVFSGAVGNAAAIIPPGVHWRFTVCPLATSACQTLNPVTVTGSTQNIGAYISANIIAPRIFADNLVYAYNATEIQDAVNGDGYINTVSQTQWLWNGAWTEISGGASSLVIPSASNITSTLSGTNTLLQADSVATSGAYGVVTFGSSYGTGQGGTTVPNAAFSLLGQHLGYGSGTSYFQCGFAVSCFYSALPNTVTNFNGGGTTTADEGNAILQDLYKPSTAYNPIALSIVGANNFLHFGTFDPIGYQQDLTANYTWLASPPGDIVNPQTGCTPSGTTSNDNTYSLAPGTLLGAIGSTISCVVNVGPPGVVFVWVRDYPTGGATGSFSVSIDGGPPATETITNGTIVSTVSNRFFAVTSNITGYLAAQYPVSAGQHTILVTDISGTVSVIGVLNPQHIKQRGINSPRLYAASEGIAVGNQSQMNTINALNLSIVQELVGFGYNITPVDLSNLNPNVDFATSATTNPPCPATTSPGPPPHPDDCGQLAIDQDFEAVINAAVPTQSYLASSYTATSFMATPTMIVGAPSSVVDSQLVVYSSQANGSGEFFQSGTGADANMHNVCTAPFCLFQGNPWATSNTFNLNGGGSILNYVASNFGDTNLTNGTSAVCPNGSPVGTSSNNALSNSGCNAATATIATGVNNGTLPGTCTTGQVYSIGNAMALCVTTNTWSLIPTVNTNTVSFTLGTGVTSATCASGFSCSPQRGTITVVGGTFTTGTCLTITWSSESPNYTNTIVSQNGGAAWLGLGHATDTPTSLAITNAVSIAGLTFNFDYSSQP
jgi:hypothetical protein